MKIDPPFSQSRLLRRAKWAIGAVVTTAAIAYFLWSVISNVAELPPIHWSWKIWAVFAGAIGIYSLVILIGGLAWYLLLKGLNEPAILGQTLVLFGLTNFAKYIPGNVGQYVGRLALAQRYGLAVSGVGFTLVLEASWEILASSALGVTAIVVAGQTISFAGVPKIWQLVLIALAAASAPFVGVWVLNKWRPGPLAKLSRGGAMRFPEKRSLYSVFLLYILMFIAMATSLYLAGYGIFNVRGHFWLITGIVAVTWVVGFVTPGAPGGVGVREAILVAAIAPLYGSGIAIALSIVFRVITTASDGIAFLAAVCLRKTFVPAVTDDSAKAECTE